MARFDGKKIVITGATSGIGLAGAVRIQSEGGRVAVTGQDPGRIAETARTLGEKALVIADDASSPDAGTALAASLTDWGELDGLWLNAGYADVDAIEEVDAAFFDRMMAANVRGPMLQLRRLSPLLKNGASIIVTSSIAAYTDNAATSVYAATKAASVALARSWAKALAPRGIRVNALVPGPIESRLRDFLPEQDRLAFEQNTTAQVPLKRIGTAEEAAAVALFLLSDEASYVTGSQYFVDGGIVMH